MDGLKLPPAKTGKRIKATITPEEFIDLIARLDERFATMVVTAVLNGLRVSELIGLRFEDLREDSIMVDERCCRSSTPKSCATRRRNPWRG